MIRINTKILALACIIGLTLIHWALLTLHIPIYDSQAGWFWIYISKPHGSLLSILSLAILVVSTALIVTRFNQYEKSKILFLILLGTSLQFCFASLEGRGIDALRDRIIYTGHAEFAKVAVKEDSITHVLSHYEELLASGELGVFPNSKSPGTLFFYMATKKIAEVGTTENERRNKALMLERLRTTASYLWPFISYLVIIPIFFLARLTVGKNAAILASALYLTIPSVNLMTLHTDEVIYPLLFIMPILLATIAAKRNSLLLIFLSGVMIYLAMWFSFALMFSVIFVAGISFIAHLQKSDFKFLDYIKFYSSLAIGFLTLHFLFEVIFNYNFLIRYEHATKFHFGFKGWEGGINLTLHFGILNMVEFFVWVGMPIALIVILNFYKAISNFIIERKFSLEYALAILLPITLIIIATIGKTKAETARLWLFLVPYMCIVSAHFIIKKFGHPARAEIFIVLFLQLGTCYLTKINQDFF